MSERWYEGGGAFNCAHCGRMFPTKKRVQRHSLRCGSAAGVVDDEWHAEEADAHEAEARARAEYEARWDG